MGEAFVIAIAADGAGSAANADEGAQFICRDLCDRLTYRLSLGPLSEITETDFRQVVEGSRAALVEYARSFDAAPRNYACTLLAAVLNERFSAFIQIGDGAIIYSDCDDPEGWAWIFWPQRGEYANSTHFITDDDALDNIQIAVRPSRIEEVALFTDGIEKLALHFETKTAFAPFFAKMFAPLRQSSAEGEDVLLSEALQKFLASPSVVQRTDDDKTLILLTRRSG